MPDSPTDTKPPITGASATKPEATSPATTVVATAPVVKPVATPGSLPGPAAGPITAAQASEALKQIDPAMLRTKIETVKTWYAKWGGKIGCNPYFYLYNTVAPLEKKLKELETFPFPDVITKFNHASDLVVNIAELKMDEKYIVHDREAYDAELARQEELKRRRAVQPANAPMAIGGV